MTERERNEDRRQAATGPTPAPELLPVRWWRDDADRVALATATNIGLWIDLFNRELDARVALAQSGAAAAEESR